MPKASTPQASPRSWLSRYYWAFFIAILFLSFVLRVHRLNEPRTYIFDEVYHAVTAKLIAKNDPRAFEWWQPSPEPNTAIDWLHPPLAKYTQALGILVYGETSFGWRISAVVFGVAVIGMVMMLSRELFETHPHRDRLSLLAGFIASMDGLLLVQSRIAMNDIHVTFFILVAIWCYVRWRKRNELSWLSATAVTAGLAVGTKWSGVFVVAGILLIEFGEMIWQLGRSWKKSAIAEKIELLLKKAGLAAVMLLIPALVYLASYAQMYSHGKDLAHLKGLHTQIWTYQTTLNATHTYQSRPWEWFLNLRPVWMHVDYVNDTQIANIYAFGNPAVFWLGGLAVLGTLGWIGWQVGQSLAHKKITKLLNKTGWPLLILLTFYGIVWLPWLASPRIMFFYHYTPAVPLMSMLLSYWLVELDARAETGLKIVAAAALIMIVGCFWVWLPHWTGLPVSKEFADTVYFVTERWR